MRMLTTSIQSKLDARMYLLSLFAHKVNDVNFYEILTKAEEHLLKGINLPDFTKNEFDGMSGLIGSMKNKIDECTLALNGKQMCEEN